MSTHKIALANSNSTPKNTRPLTASQVCAHAESFWYGRKGFKGKIDKRDVELHGMMLLGLNKGMRFDKISKLMVSQVTPNNGEVSVNITQSIKNPLSTGLTSY